MKKRGNYLLVFVLIFSVLALNLSLISSQPNSCRLDVSLINQDPYPVIPGEYVEVVFQVSGVENADCEGAKFEVVEDYPFSLDKDSSSSREISGSTFVSDYKKSWMIPYKLRVDEDAMDGMNELNIKYAPGTSDETIYSEDFDIKVEDVRVDFEVSVRDYDKDTNTLTFEILNTGENNVEALTVDIPEQEGLNLKGSPRKIIGILDSNEETTFNFDLVSESEEIDTKITYTDEIGERRTLNKSVYFNPDNFETQDSQREEMSFWFYLSIVLIAYMVFRWWRKKKKSKKGSKK